MKNRSVMIETPMGSALKYDYDLKQKYFKLNKILPLGMVFPYDFGFIPGTKGEDGDPLDVIIISEFKSFPGCVMDCRIIAVMRSIQKEKGGKSIRNDRFIAVPALSVLYAGVHTVKQIPPVFLAELAAFFKQYNKLGGKKFKVLDICDAKEARKLLKH